MNKRKEMSHSPTLPIMIPIFFIISSLSYRTIKIRANLSLRNRFAQAVGVNNLLLPSWFFPHIPPVTKGF